MTHTTTDSLSDVIIPHPFDLDEDGINRPGLYKNDFYRAIHDGDQPLVRVRRPNGAEVLLVTRYEDVLKVLRDGQQFSRQKAARWDMVPIKETMLALDGKEHAQVRDVVKDWFTRPAIDRMSDGITARAAALASAMKEGPKPAELLTAFAVPLALDSISDMLGMPEEDREEFRHWAGPLLGTSNPDEAMAGIMAMREYLGKKIEQRRKKPANDLLTEIALKGADLPHERLLWLPLSLFAGGTDTVISSVGTFTEVLLKKPYGGYDTAYRYLIDHEKAIPGAVTELERLCSTSADDGMIREVVEQTTLPSGAVLHVGKLVIPSFDAANRDPRKFPNPLQMDFARNPNPHVSFGYGVHHCIGRYLGHTNVITAFRTLTREFPGLQLATRSIERKTNQSVAGPIAVPVTWN